MPSDTSTGEAALSPGWTRKSLAELCRILSGGTPPKSEARYWIGDVPWVSGKDMKSARLFDAIDHVSVDAIGAGTRMAPAGAVLLLVRGMGLAKDLPVAVAKRAMAFNQDIKALVPKVDGMGPFIRAAIYANKAQLLARIVPSAHGTMTLNLDDIESFEVAAPDDAAEAIALGELLDQVHDLADSATQELLVAEHLKRAAMRALFTKGMRGEAQKDTEIGSVPESWEVRPLEAIANIYSSSRLGYGELLAREELPSAPSSLHVLGIKVIDMTRCEAESVLDDAELKKFVPKAEAEQRCIAPGAIVFPKNGAAISTNKKRRVGSWCVLDPNVMALHAKEEVDQAFLFHWMLNFDLRSLVKPGPVPNFGKGDISGISVQFPPTLDEQREIVAVLNAIDRKIDLQKRKRAVLDELFKALLHKLMTGEIRVADLDLSALEPAKETEAAA